MVRPLYKLSEVKARSDKLAAGRHSDGGGLYLNVTATGSKSWVFIWRRGDKRSEMGLGSYPAISLASARDLARQYREIVATGGNPKDERDRTAEPTFGECVEKFLASMQSQWSNQKHRQQWRSTLETYCAAIWSRRVSTIETQDVLSILNPIWQAKQETASRLRGRIERVLDYAKAHGWRQGENPALWRGHLRNVLPTHKKADRGHHAAMAYADVPTFMARLREREAIASHALRFLILTASRTGETIGATWQEIDLEAATWIIPAKRMKARREHRVPLSDEALGILSALKETAPTDAPYIFPGQSRGRPLSNMAFAKLLERMDVEGVTAHGFRSSFRDWLGDATPYARELGEQALAHVIGSATEQAYRRLDALEKRRTIMQAWADFCRADKSAKVVPFRKDAG